MGRLYAGTVGSPSGRCFPFALATYTRLTGLGAHWPLWICTEAAKKAFPGAVTTTAPSTPAVLRPALSPVTRRTLNRALARDRSISFCKLRTFLRSPACDAAKSVAANAVRRPRRVYADGAFGSLALADLVTPGCSNTSALQPQILWLWCQLGLTCVGSHTTGRPLSRGAEPGRGGEPATTDGAGTPPGARL